MEKNEQPGAYVLQNSLEEMVRDRAKPIVAKMNMCQCEKCFLDVCALVLNQLTPKYATTAKGSLMARVPAMNSKKEMELMVMITRCAKMVADRPSH